MPCFYDSVLHFLGHMSSWFIIVCQYLNGSEVLKVTMMAHGWLLALRKKVYQVFPFPSEKGKYNSINWSSNSESFDSVLVDSKGRLIIWAVTLLGYYSDYSFIQVFTAVRWKYNHLLSEPMNTLIYSFT